MTLTIITRRHVSARSRFYHIERIGGLLTCRQVTAASGASVEDGQVYLFQSIDETLTEGEEGEGKVYVYVGSFVHGGPTDDIVDSSKTEMGGNLCFFAYFALSTSTSRLCPYTARYARSDVIPPPRLNEGFGRANRRQALAPNIRPHLMPIFRRLRGV
ncbi:hypothetical protein CONLIGDRAFT_645080 [Coniochaeta ligniaria NRRL 30616]|uniref:Uncharacterized protein n=1 Tax=Coniochaeta ligniaria NRRL 30616 TaxID=1408157 RepID=A0A1J7JMJ1_9PEZI|nr:hypothetical protein CONLIGDRAFT_645080 [Coniochaeta ligniaria NRRL 30616]